MSHLRKPENNRAIRILLVDGNVDFLHVATDFLQRWPELLVVGAVTRVQGTLARIQSLQPQVILLDLDTPGLAGLESIPRLQAMMPGVSIIALTMSSGSAYQGAALTAGADALVSKTALLTDLLPAIQQVSRTSVPQLDRIAAVATPAAEP